LGGDGRASVAPYCISGFWEVVRTVTLGFTVAVLFSTNVSKTDVTDSKK